MITASVLAKMTDVPVFTVRHYTRIGLLSPVRNSVNGYKMYRPSDVERLNFITSAKELGFTLAEIAEILDHAAHRDTPCPMVREIVDKRIEENRQRIAELKRLQKRLEKAADLWSGMNNSIPNGHSVCQLIETFSEIEKTA